MNAMILSSLWFAQMRRDSVCAATCKDDCLLKSKQHFCREKPARMSSNDPPLPRSVVSPSQLVAAAPVSAPAHSHGDMACN